MYRAARAEGLAGSKQTVTVAGVFLGFKFSCGLVNLRHCDALCEPTCVTVLLGW